MPRGTFTTAEWAMLRLAPWTVAVGVASREPDPTRREFVVVTSAVRRACHHAAVEPGLIGDIACSLCGRDLPTCRDLGLSDADRGGRDPGRAAVARCRVISEVLGARVGPDEAAQVRSWLVEVASLVAEVAGRGHESCGPLASTPAREALAEITDALQVPSGRAEAVAATSG
ncbi:MAG: hypothetical protein S0880_23840 [Actinomycetota bacterium]|nr:hypothetical protein [Actinomycetota bacterium]